MISPTPPFRGLSNVHYQVYHFSSVSTSQVCNVKLALQHYLSDVCSSAIMCYDFILYLICTRIFEFMYYMSYI